MTDTQEYVILDPEHLALTDRGPVLRGSKCPECKLHFFPPRWECAVDQTPCADVDLSIEGKLHVATYVHFPAYGKSTLQSEGYGVGQVDLPEGVRVQAILAGDRARWVHGTVMRLVTESVGEDDLGRSRIAYRFAPRPSTTPESVGWLAARAAQQWPDATFAHLGDRTLTFRELSARINTAAAELIRAGVEPSDKVLVHLPNGFEVVVFQLAAWRIGAIAVPVVPIYRRHELSDIVGDVRPRVIITSGSSGNGDNTGLFDEIVAAHGLQDVGKWQVGGDAEGWFPAPGYEHGEHAVDLPDPAEQTECCLILYTSGTTSTPKGVMLSSASLVEALAGWTAIGVGHDDVALAVAPLAHIAGLIPGALLPLTVGCPTVIMPKWDRHRAVALIHEHKATISAGAAVFLHDLVDEYRSSPPDVHRLSHFISGGASTPPELVREAEQVGMRASRAFGMTETAGVITIAAPDAPLEQRAQYDGHLVDSISVRIVDAEGNELPPGEEGALRIRGPQLLIGYTDPQRTAEQFQDGWFDPGDIGRVTADGWLQITGRTKDIINRGGEKFSARDIEEALLRYPDVERAAVIAVPHQRFGEAVGAFLVLAAGTSWDGPENLTAFLIESGLAKAKVPVEWTILDHLPVTASGKIQKHLLAELRNTTKEH
ncbi:AMP-binding protein [Nocardia sp. R6R-6]|uniref:AMP-binding protein n=1 Tax=Nocardia sp. R6R-6 TaxID=3459303 RepID=UPI00403D91DE